MTETEQGKTTTPWVSILSLPTCVALMWAGAVWGVDELEFGAAQRVVSTVLIWFVVFTPLFFQSRTIEVDPL